MNVGEKQSKSHGHNWDFISRLMLGMGFISCAFINLGFVIGIPLIIFAYIRSKSNNKDTEKELFGWKGANKTNKRVKCCIKKGLKSIYNDGYREKEKSYTTIICPSCMRRLRVPENRGNIKIRCPVCSHKFTTKT